MEADLNAQVNGFIDSSTCIYLLASNTSEGGRMDGWIDHVMHREKKHVVYVLIASKLTDNIVSVHISNLIDGTKDMGQLIR